MPKKECEMRNATQEANANCEMRHSTRCRFRTGAGIMTEPVYGPIRAESRISQFAFASPGAECRISHFAFCLQLPATSSSISSGISIPYFALSARAAAWASVVWPSALGW